MKVNDVDLPDLFRRHICQTSDQPLGLDIVRARGATLETRDGRQYIDLIAGIAVNNVGHCHPAVVAAIQRQSEQYLHAMVYGEYVLEPQTRLATRLAEVAPGDLSVCYFTNSGAEAVEGALKLAKKATGRANVVAFHRSYHGDTHGALSVTGREVYRRPFEPLLPDVRFLPFDDLDALSAIGPDTAAVIMEPIQGEGGILVPSDDFLPAVRARCSRVGALLIFDEVQTGMGRTGRLFASEWWDVCPDILVLAKALGGGMPLGAFVGSPSLMGCLSHDPPLSHVTTFGGHPVCCAAGLASLEVIIEQDLPARAIEVGEEIRSRVLRAADRFGGVVDIRGRGLLLGLVMTDPDRTRRFAAEALEAGTVIGWTLHSDTIIRIAPPLNISREEMDAGLSALEHALEASVDG